MSSIKYAAVHISNRALVSINFCRMFYIDFKCLLKQCLYFLFCYKLCGEIKGYA